MKYHRIWHFIRVCIVWFDKISYFEIITYDPSIITMDRPDLAVSNFMELFIGQNMVNPLNKLNQRFYRCRDISFQFENLNISFQF